MHALTLARQRIRDRIQSPTTPEPVRLAHGLVENGQSRLLPVLASNLAQVILLRGYDAGTLDLIYANRVQPRSGLVGRIADRMVLDQPLHEAFRERLDATAREMCAAAAVYLRESHLSEMETSFRVLSAPCGLGAELAGFAQRFQIRHPDLVSSVRCWGVDADPDGAMLQKAAERLQSSGMKVSFIREDLRRHREVAAVARKEGPFHLVCGVGLTAGRTLEEVRDLVRFYAGLMATGGTLLIDRWQPAEATRRSVGLVPEFEHFGTVEFKEMLSGAGFGIEREHPTAEGGCVLLVARKTGLA